MGGDDASGALAFANRDVADEVSAHDRYTRACQIRERGSGRVPEAVARTHRDERDLRGQRTQRGVRYRVRAAVMAHLQHVDAGQLARARERVQHV